MRVFPGGASGKNNKKLPAKAGDQSLHPQDPLEKEMEGHSRILAWKIPWTGESSRLQSTQSQNQHN